MRFCDDILFGREVSGPLRGVEIRVSVRMALTNLPHLRLMLCPLLYRFI